ncbi:MAG: SpoIIE family protein phosphatase [Rhodothermaceae bacterium]|nr:SpoIIE family protein phosphatase [Rhodothermaceae bacterium]
MTDYSILVVEDERTLRRLLEYRLRKHYNVRSVANGIEALNSVANSIPDLIISDIMMPKMDGYALQSELQKNLNTRTIPFIFLTAKADDNSRLKGMRTGVDDYITKPFDLEQLLSRIDRLLERTRLFQTQLEGKIGEDFSKRLMPKRMPHVEGYEVSYINEPREHGGGDLFDWTEPVPGQYFFTVGDVMGKGIQAKFYAFTFQSYVRGTLHTMLAPNISPAEVLHNVNTVLLDDEVMEDTFASLLLIRWDVRNHSITYANAGHCRPFLVSPNKCQLIEKSDLILGLDPHATFQDHTVEIEPGSGVLAYTDGLIEQHSKDGSMIGEDGLQEILADLDSSSDLPARLMQATLERSRSNVLDDDLLAFWLKRF